MTALLTKVFVLIPLTCHAGHCTHLEPAPPPMTFQSAQACNLFASQAAIIAGTIYRCKASWQQQV